jgi:site-specific DNA-methyltransferase (adenine-specific)
MNKDLHFSSKKQDWATPNDLFNELDRHIGFVLDAAASEWNAKCHNYYDEEDNGLDQGWFGCTWINPPYSRGLGNWVHKAATEHTKGNTSMIAMLIPARPDTRYWHEWVFPYANAILFIKGRIKFIQRDGTPGDAAPFPSCVIFYTKEDHSETYHELQGSGLGQVVIINPV